MEGKVHLYSGDGKGKTSAAVGLSVRARGHGLNVCFAQFLKSGRSAELRVLETIGVRVVSGQSVEKFSFKMTDEEKAGVRKENDERLDWLWQLANSGDIDVLVLDEAVGAAFGTGLLDAQKLLRFVREKPSHLELVLTGRDPSKELSEAVDYHTNLCLRRHPYVSEGLVARAGIEY